MANSEEPDEMPHIAAFRQVLHCLLKQSRSSKKEIQQFLNIIQCDPSIYTRDVFYVRREVGLMKTAKVNAYIMHIFGKIELLSIYAT